jgi:nucleoredoxin
VKHLSLVLACLALSISPLVAGPIDVVKENLVKLDKGKIVPFDAAGWDGKKYYAIYYSAHWCGPCVAFTPELVRWYGRMSKMHPEFELVFFSHDKTAEDMEAYMREMRMPWPAVKFEEKEKIRSWAGNEGIPYLIVLDAAGNVVADSKKDGKYQGAKGAMEDFTKLLRKEKAASSSGSSFDDFSKKSSTPQ